MFREGAPDFFDLIIVVNEGHAFERVVSLLSRTVAAANHPGERPLRQALGVSLCGS
jgi:hypothetical protein